MSAQTKARRASEGFSPDRSQADWPKILVDAVTKPGVISQAYSQFWNYSVGNQLLAWFQCLERNLEPGPIHTFLGWKELGRYVKKGEKALTLCMPVTVKRKDAEPEMDDEVIRSGDGAERIQESFTRFIYRPHWFVLAQTEGNEYVPVEIPEWNEKRALENLQITRIQFKHTDGNAQGYAVERHVAISPIAFMPHRTLFHEIAHVVLGHTEELRRMDDGDESTPRDIREVEAECVSLICCQSLGLPGEGFSRGYIQHWIKGKQIPDRSAQKIFKAADEVLKAGRSESR
jgi:antirestriction protein ArdC